MKTSDQGFNPTRFLVIPRVLIFLFDSCERVLLIRGSDTKSRWPGRYNGLGGHVEANEHVIEAARRELREEAGIKNVEIKLVGQIMINVSEKSGIALFIFRGIYDGEVISNSQEGYVEWKKISELPLLHAVDDLQVLVQRTKYHRQGDSIFFGKYCFDENGKIEKLWD